LEQTGFQSEELPLTLKKDAMASKFIIKDMFVSDQYVYRFGGMWDSEVEEMMATIAVKGTCEGFNYCSIKDRHFVPFDLKGSSTAVRSVCNSIQV
jgi:hypothetical protein